MRRRFNADSHLIRGEGSVISDVRAILFDVYGTLATWYPDRFVLHQRAASKFGIEVTQEGIDAGYAVAEAYMTHENTNHTDPFDDTGRKRPVLRKVRADGVGRGAVLRSTSN